MDKQRPALLTAGSNALLPRRQEGTRDTILLDNNGFWRKVMVGRLPEGDKTTPETRARGLAVLKAAFQDGDFTLYPPPDIETVDDTDEENPRALNMFLKDNDIVNLINQTIQDSDLNSEFYNKYTDCANRLWSGSFYYPAFAKQRLDSLLRIDRLSCLHYLRVYSKSAINK